MNDETMFTAILVDRDPNYKHWGVKLKNNHDGRIYWIDAWASEYDSPQTLVTLNWYQTEFNTNDPEDSERMILQESAEAYEAAYIAASNALVATGEMIKTGLGLCLVDSKPE